VTLSTNRDSLGYWEHFGQFLVRLSLLSKIRKGLRLKRSCESGLTHLCRALSSLPVLAVMLSVFKFPTEFRSSRRFSALGISVASLITSASARDRHSLTPPLPTDEIAAAALPADVRSETLACTTGAALLLGLETVFNKRSHHPAVPSGRRVIERSPRSKKVYIFPTISGFFLCSNRVVCSKSGAYFLISRSTKICRATASTVANIQLLRAECPEYHVMPEFRPLIVHVNALFHCV